MQYCEFRVVPAPRRGKKAKGVKTAEERFALALSELMNRMGAEGWEYQRSDSLPCETKSLWGGSKVEMQTVLVFHRMLVQAAPVMQPAVVAAPMAIAPAAAAMQAPSMPAAALAPAAPGSANPASPFRTGGHPVTIVPGSIPLPEPVPARTAMPARPEGGKAPALGGARPGLAAE